MSEQNQDMTDLLNLKQQIIELVKSGPDADKAQLAQCDLDLESCALKLGRSPLYYSLKSLVQHARKDFNGSVITCLQGGLLSVAVESLKSAMESEDKEIKLKGESGLWTSMALSLSNLNLDMAVGACLISLTLNGEDPVAREIMGQLMAKVSERSKTAEASDD